VSSPSLERFRSLAETMGLARVVRSMEILGHALVDMREAPDAQVVLEIAVVRAVRPDLDSGMEALSERVSVLERSLSGDAAFPRPGSDRAAPIAPPAPAGRVGDVGRRPSVGAVRRSKEAVGAAPATPPGPSPAPETDESTSGASPEPAREEAATPAAAAEAPALTVDRDALTEAWGDGILQALPARAKARYASGRFVAVDEQGAHFALPNAAHRDQCAEQQTLVEAALAAHFGEPVKLVLVIDDGPSARPSPGGPGIAPSSAPTALDDAEELDGVDPEDLVGNGAPDETAAAEARLLQAFPGASEVTN
jgi:hypothetical protein